MFLRPDFLNLTVCLLGLYMMFNIDMISKTKFRMLVLGIFLSLIYDIIWFYIKHSEYAGGSDLTKSDGNTEVAIRKFSLLVSYTSFFFRVSNKLILTICYSLL